MRRTLNLTFEISPNEGALVTISGGAGGRRAVSFGPDSNMEEVKTRIGDYALEAITEAGGEELQQHYKDHWNGWTPVDSPHTKAQTARSG